MSKSISEATTKPFSEACVRNAPPILEILKKIILRDQPQKLLEIGSGTGQHAVLLAPEFPQLIWQTSDQVENHPAITDWIKDGPSNILPPKAFEVGENTINAKTYDIVFIANVLHIMAWSLASVLFQDLGRSMRPGSHLVIYGPLNYGGNYTSESNRDFDRYLKQKFAVAGIREFEELRDLALKHKFNLERDYEMPANNRCLHFIKI